MSHTAASSDIQDKVTAEVSQVSYGSQIGSGFSNFGTIDLGPAAISPPQIALGSTNSPEAFSMERRAQTSHIQKLFETGFLWQASQTCEKSAVQGCQLNLFKSRLGTE